MNGQEENYLEVFMGKFIITGGKRLCGSVKVDCAKNAYLPILAASILCEGKIVLKSCPDFADINNMNMILQALGMEVGKSW